MPKPGPRGDDEVAVDKRRTVVAKLYLEGFTQLEIAEKVGISQPTVSLDLKAVRDSWKNDAISDFDDKVRQELASLNHQEEQLWKAWYRSCGVEVIQTQSVERELRSDPDDIADEMVDKIKSKKGRKSVVATRMIPVKESDKKVSKQLIGNPIFMSEIRAVRELRCKLLGLIKKDEPEKQQVNVNVISGEVWDKISHIRTEPDEIETRLKQLEALPDVVPSSREALPDAPQPLPSTDPSANGKH